MTMLESDAQPRAASQLSPPLADNAAFLSQWSLDCAAHEYEFGKIATESRKLTIAMRAWIAAGLILDRQELDANLKTISDTEASQILTCKALDEATKQAHKLEVLLIPVSKP